MRRRRQSGFRLIQDSVSYVPDSSATNKTNVRDGSKYLREFYPHMFIEDVRLSIMPIGGHVREGRPFSIILEPPSNETELVVAAAVTDDDYWSGLSGAVCDFVARRSVELLAFETSTFEIAYMSDLKNGDLIGFKLARIPPTTLVRSGGRLLQVLPDEVAAELGKPREIQLAPESILAFRLPSRLQGKIRHSMELLTILGSRVEPEFFMKELMTFGSLKTPYDVKANLHTQRLALANATRPSGWNARMSFEEEALEYYLMYRHLQFQRFKIELRDAILDTLNQGIMRAGERLGFTARVLVAGLPTLADVQDTIARLERGDSSFAQLLQPFN